MSSIDIRSSNLENIAIGSLAAKWSARGDRILRYYIDFRHKKLNLHRELSAPEIFILQSKVDALMAAWDEKYAQFEDRRQLQAGKETAEDMCAEAEQKLSSLHRILSATLAVNDSVNWDDLKDHSAPPAPAHFPDAKPVLQSQPRPEYSEPPYHPPRISIFDLLFGRKERKLTEAEAEYAKMAEQAAAQHARAVEQWEEDETRRRQIFEASLSAWEKGRADFLAEQEQKNQAFLDNQAERNSKVDLLMSTLAEGDSQAVIEHASLVLDASDYEGLFEKSFVLQYHPDGKLLLAAYDLPGPDDLPTLRAIKFVKSTGELRETHISAREKAANFEAVVYQICLRTIHELFEADEFHNIEKTLFNGYVNFIDRRTGQEARSCLLSIMVGKDEFERIDLSRIEPKTCFKSLKGVSGASLASLAAIPPVMEMDREDKRFIESMDVGSSLDETTNIAAISWEDFEHLVRELFEKEFQTRGGEVRVTQASSDGGVDAIAFDPDPISGGKIVIQAKRYTKTVGVSAVRDLYGTVLNEGASKGILVTTADYGPDAYKFATGKPITLLTGANLLHMLQKHGYRARIDVKEAREMMAAANAVK